MDGHHLGINGCGRAGDDFSLCHLHQALDDHQGKEMTAKRKLFSKESIEEMIDERARKIAEEVVNDSKVPSGIITVNEGTLTEESLNKIKEFMDDARDNPDFHRIIVLEAENLTGRKEATIRWIPTNGIDSPPIIQLHKDGVTGTVISGSIEEVREILRENGNILPGLEIDEP